MPEVSIIIPVYNVEQYIERCARSLFEQTETDLEFIFVNDCTPDSSMQILNDVIKDYPSRKNHIKILENEKNLGVAETRFKGIMEASGEYIIHCDSDDWVDRDMYRILYEKAKAENLDIVWCDFYRTDGITNKYDKQNTLQEKSYVLKNILIAKKMGSLCNHLVKHSLLLEHQYIEPISSFMEDVVLLVQYFYYSNKIGYVNQPLYYYYENIESISNSDTKDKTLNQVAQMDINLQIIFAFIKQNKLDKTLKNEIIFRKFFNKRWLLPVIKSPKDCSLWINEYKEINFRMFFNPYISVKDRITSILVELRLYPILKWIR